MFIDISHLIPQLSRPISWDLSLTFHSFVSKFCLTSELKPHHRYGDIRDTYVFADFASPAGRSSPAPDCCSREAVARGPSPPHSARDFTRPQEVRICNLFCRSLVVYREHIQGRRHLAKVARVTDGVQKCDVCDLSFESKRQYESHIGGRRHP